MTNTAPSESQREFIAHVKQSENGNWSLHELSDHLKSVSKLAAKFAQPFDGQNWAILAGLWHDLGKYRPAFQQYIRIVSGYSEDAHIEQSGKPVHSEAGAAHAVAWNKSAGRFLAYLIAGHHSGLPDWNKAEAGTASLFNRLVRAEQEQHLAEVLKTTGIPQDIVASTTNVKDLSRPRGGSNGLHLWLRMLFSCLVDADFLDTERFMDPVQAQQRANPYSIEYLKQQFDNYMAVKSASAEATLVNQKRAEILRDCREAALESQGVFTLTVPTGGGKTLSGMAFALEHAIKHNKHRIIVAIPYTSIIEQTAEQYRHIFGDDAVLEHHSNLDPDSPEQENTRNRLASENWDVPIIVTTNVQLLESLFSARTSRCRKLHNLANSVIILDEAQLLPPDYLKPILNVLCLLTDHYGVTLVLSTATQPALGTVKDSFDRVVFEGLDAKKEIISDVDGLFSQMKRVEIQKPSDLSVRYSWNELAQELLQYPSVLVIVNSRRDARELFDLMPEGTIHLSALMCGEHRSRIISDIKKRLKAGENLRVVSTQLVEAGVDLDFPVVYRALAGLDSIAQAAGRCNREGKLSKGKVVVFQPPKSPAKGLLLFGEQATRTVWHQKEDDLLSHQLFNVYFRQFFAQVDADAHQIMPLLTQGASCGEVQFRTAAERFRLIPDIGTTILVPYGIVGFDLMDRLKREGPHRTLMRKLQRYSVNIYDPEFLALKSIGAVEELSPGIFGVCVTNAYDELLGLLPAGKIYTGNPAQSVI